MFELVSFNVYYTRTIGFLHILRVTVCFWNEPRKFDDETCGVSDELWSFGFDPKTWLRDSKIGCQNW